MKVNYNNLSALAQCATPASKTSTNTSSACLTLSLFNSTGIIKFIKQ